MVKKPPVRKSGLAGNLHAHGCQRCTTRYQDACTTPETNDLCGACRGDKPSSLVASRLPRDCCREQARLVTKDEKKTYALAGSTLWFICPRCARTHPFKPEARPT